ncbi:galectin-4 isoform X1 [Spodoptera frugiperda]|uniref:Galectin n=1 Tax=Spodoptera frugiperda TaxID=7108 RepID=A0A9R0EHH6_SPOFR|nr:galectin-4 isoform X1 [Spodoptera frugiperda]
MVCFGDRCGCGAFCRRLFCRSRPPETKENEENLPVSLSQLAEARDVKFTQTLTEPLSIGSHIICTGTPSNDLPWFAVNIGSGDIDSGRGDIAVHFNVRLPQNYVVRNTRRHNKWGPEETTAFRLFPFKTDHPFTIEIVVDEKETLWAVDGIQYCSYAHRNPSPLTAEWVQVTGIRDATLQIQKTDIFPTLAPSPIEVPIRPSVDSPAEASEPAWQPNAIASLSTGIPEGHQLVIYGRLRPLLHSFAIDLMDTAREWPRPNVLAHVNVRAYFESQRERQLVVLNAWLGEWGPERRQRTARLIPGSRTTLRIVRQPADWAVYADDLLIGELEFRAAANGVRAVRIRGDLYPEQMYLCPATSSPIRD